MSRLFLLILNNTYAASWIILAVIVLRFIFERFIKKVPKWVNCLLWELAAIRLVFPLNIESIFSLVPSAKPIPVDIEYVRIPQINSGIGAVNAAINPVLENNFTAQEIAGVNPMQIVITAATYIWMIVVVGLLLYAIISYIFLKKQVGNAKLVENGIYICDIIVSPFILGIFYPCIYIPNGMDEEAYHCVMAHEKAHIKRGDHIWKPLGFLILTVYWFNPLCWIAYILLCKDIEYACDERVTKDKDKDWKVKYCQTLLDCSTQRKPAAVCPVAFGEISVKDRVLSVINYKKPSFWIICISVIICIVMGVCFLTNPVASNPEAAAQSEEPAASSQEKPEISELMSQTKEDYELLSGDELLGYLDSLPNKAESLAKENCFVISNRGTCYGYNFFLDFLDSYNSNQKSAITIGQFTVEGDLILSYIAYDGEKVTVTKDSRRDKFAGNGNHIYTKSSKYFSVMQFSENDMNIMFMHDEPDMTPEKIEKIMASSSMESGAASGFYWIGSYTAAGVVNYPVEIEETKNVNNGFGYITGICIFR